jgi:hypothetical protein
MFPLPETVTHLPGLFVTHVSGLYRLGRFLVRQVANPLLTSPSGGGIRQRWGAIPWTPYRGGFFAGPCLAASFLGVSFLAVSFLGALRRVLTTGGSGRPAGASAL